jgi:lipopolysaccharide export system ATP-binding protein
LTEIAPARFEGIDLCLDYGARRVVANLSIAVEGSEIVGLLGPNGAGKTSTFYMMVGLIRPAEGRVLLDGEEITRLPLDRRARRGIAYLPQEASVFRDLTVEENLLGVLEFQPLNRKERQARADELLEEMGLTAVRRSLGRVLSGGERRRLEIARALAISPKFLLLDEPFAGIDPKQVEDLQEMVLRLKRSGIGILITDHNVHEMLDVVDTATIIFQGRVLKSGRSSDLVDDPEVREHYLGEKFRWHATPGGTF